MFCRYCGCKVDRRTMECTNCGKAVGSLEGGVGFWDLAGKSNAVKPTADNGNTEMILRKLEYMEKKKSPLLIAAIVLLAVCLLINILLVGMYSGLNKNIEHLSYNIQLLREHSEIEEAVPNTEPAVLATEPEMTESSEETFEEFSIQITKQATSEVLSDDYITRGAEQRRDAGSEVISAVPSQLQVRILDL